MNKGKMDERESVMRLRSLYRRGITREPPMWHSVKKCAEAIGLTTDQLRRRLKGVSSDADVSKAISLVESKLGPEPKKATDESPGNELTRLYELGIAQSVWSNKTGCAKAIGISTDTFRTIELMKQWPTAPRRSKFLSLAFKRLRSKVTHTAMKEAKNRFDRLLAGSDEEPDDHGDNIRFIIRADSFRTYDGVVTDEEIEDLRKRVEDLRRCLMRLAQINDEKTRARAHKVLGRELDELFLTFRVFKKVVPTAAAAKIDADRRGLQTFLDASEK